MSIFMIYSLCFILSGLSFGKDEGSSYKVDEQTMRIADGECLHLILNFSRHLPPVTSTSCKHDNTTTGISTETTSKRSPEKRKMPKFAKHGSFNIALLSLFGGLVLVVLRQRFHVVQQLTNGGVESSLRNTTFPTSAHDGIVPMVYDKKTLPCYPSSKNWLDSNIRSQQTRTGIFFVESSKTDSTTGTSITLKMASSFSKDYKMCKVRFSHASASKMQYHERDEERSFLWSLVREPTSRAMLEFAHYQVSWRNVPPTLENMKQYFHHVKRHNKQLKTLALTSSKHVIGHEREAIHTILNEYDFLGVTERMDESAVALQMLLGLKISHVMYIPRYAFLMDSSFLSFRFVNDEHQPCTLYLYNFAAVTIPRKNMTVDRIKGNVGSFQTLTFHKGYKTISKVTNGTESFIGIPYCTKLRICLWT